MEDSPIVVTCFRCMSKVFEVEDGVFGCDSCKSLWTYNGRGWININKESNNSSEKVKSKK